MNELQSMWQKYDEKLSETARLNREILKRLLQAKPERRINWIRMKAGFNLVLPLVLLVLILLPRMTFRNEIDFYAGSILFGVVFIVFYYWAVNYFLLVNRIDFTNPVIYIRKNIMQLEKYKIKISKLGYLLIPFGMLGIFLMADYPVFSRSSVIPLLCIVAVFLGSVYYTFRYQLFEQFRKIDRELNEIEQLERK